MHFCFTAVKLSGIASRVAWNGVERVSRGAIVTAIRGRPAPLDTVSRTRPTRDAINLMAVAFLFRGKPRSEKH